MVQVQPIHRLELGDHSAACVKLYDFEERTIDGRFQSSCTENSLRTLDKRIINDESGLLHAKSIPDMALDSYVQKGWKYILLLHSSFSDNGCRQRIP